MMKVKEIYSCICGHHKWLISSDGLLMCPKCGREYQLPIGITIHEDQVMRVFLEPKEFNKDREKLLLECETVRGKVIWKEE